jgi:hypothetical protein
VLAKRPTRVLVVAHPGEAPTEHAAPAGAESDG